MDEPIIFDFVEGRAYGPGDDGYDEARERFEANARALEEATTTPA